MENNTSAQSSQPVQAVQLPPPPASMPQKKSRKAVVYLIALVAVALIVAVLYLQIYSTTQSIQTTNTTTISASTSTAQTTLIQTTLFPQVSTAYKIYSFIKAFNITDKQGNYSISNLTMPDNITLAQQPNYDCIGNATLKWYAQGNLNTQSPVISSFSGINSSYPIQVFLKVAMLNRSTYPYYESRFNQNGGYCNPALWNPLIFNTTFSDTQMKINGVDAYVLKFSNFNSYAMKYDGITYSGPNSDVVFYMVAAFYKNMLVESGATYIGPQYASAAIPISLVNRTISSLSNMNLS